nr:HAMP domain-containing sensor histidine kinase [Azospirillum soli]
MALFGLALLLSAGLVVFALLYDVTDSFLEGQAGQAAAAELEGLEAHHRRGGLPKLRQVLEDRMVTGHPIAGVYLLSGPDGARVAGNLPAWPDAVPDAEGRLFFQADAAKTGTEGPPPGTQPVLAFTRTLLDGHRLLVGAWLGERRQFRNRIVETLFWGFIVIAGMSAAGGLAIRRNVTRRLETINRTTRQIIDGQLHARIPHSPGGDELDRLAANLNDMLDKIERLMNGLRHLSDDIAHDLRTPLNRLRGQLEMVAIEMREDDPVREAVQDAIQEADRLLEMFGALLSIAKAEAGYQRMPLTDVALSPVVWRVVELYEPVAEEKSMALSVRIDRPFVVRGQEQLLAQALANLVDNAVKHTPEGGGILVAVAPSQDEPGTGELIVADSGPGIPPEDRKRVLGRFIRLDRSRSTPGNGLGLALVDAVVRLHGARLVMEDNGPGLRVRLCFPILAIHDVGSVTVD